MIKSRFGQDVDQVVLRFLPFLRTLRVSPDTLTLFGVVVSAAAAYAFASHWTFSAGLLLIASGLFDLVDGVVARQQGSASQAGAFLDSSMDRVADLLVLSGIAVAMARAPAGPAIGGLVLVCWAMIGSVMTSYTRAKAEAELGESFSVGWVERAERTVVLILGALTGLLTPALWFVAIGATVTTVQRIVVARRLLRERALREPEDGTIDQIHDAEATEDADQTGGAARLRDG